jgi:hypothetical protein
MRKPKVKTSGHHVPNLWSSSASPPGRQSLSISSWQSLSISSWQRKLQGRQRLLLLLHFSGGQSLPEQLRQQSAGYCRLCQSALRQEKGLQGDYETHLLRERGLPKSSLLEAFSECGIACVSAISFGIQYTGVRDSLDRRVGKDRIHKKPSPPPTTSWSGHAAKASVGLSLIH